MQDTNRSDADLFVGGVRNVSETEIAAIFEGAGIEIARVAILKDHEGRSKGCAFVYLARSEDRTEALALDGLALGGRSIRISLARPRTPRAAVAG